MAREMRFPLWVKLVSFVTMLILFSLGLITVLVAFFVSTDVSKTAQKNNFNINEMSAQTTLNELTSYKTNTSLLLKSVSILRLSTDFAMQSMQMEPDNKRYYAEQSSHLFESFFNQNKNTIGIALRSSSNISGEPEIIINKYNADASHVNDAMFSDFVRDNTEVLNRSLVEETFLFNAAPHFWGLPILAMSFPISNFESEDLFSVVVFFNSSSITESFGTGANSTTVINYSGDVLISANQDMIKDGANISDDVFVRHAIKTAVLESIQTVSGKHNTIGSKSKNHFKNNSGVEFFGDSYSINEFNIIVLSTIPLDIIFEGISATTRRNIYLSLLIWFLSVLFLWFFSKSISNPLRELKNAVQSIEAGNYNINLSHATSDETGILTNSIQSMSNALKNFERFTNKSLARLAQKGMLTTGGAAKQATIFFSDIRSFTAISEKLRADEVVEFLNDYMERMVACIIVTGGAIDKFIGDAIMAHWGAEESSGSFERDALNGVCAALMMRASLMCFNSGRGGDKQPIIKIGCGLNSGIVVAGQIGSLERVAYTVIGQAVSFADRCETFNKPFGTEIIISEYTYNLVGKYLITEEMKTVEENGKKVKIFAVVNIANPAISQKLLSDLAKIPKTDIEICKKCVGPDGPKKLSELRELLGIPSPDLSGLNLDEEEKKYTLKKETVEP